MLLHARDQRVDRRGGLAAVRDRIDRQAEIDVVSAGVDAVDLGLALLVDLDPVPSLDEGLEP